MERLRRSPHRPSGYLPSLSDVNWQDVSDVLLPPGGLSGRRVDGLELLTVEKLEFSIYAINVNVDIRLATET